ncbi:MAG: hypothetical protein MHM6MM_007726, partial [Cercozoa sp. M6MM]
FMHIAHHSAHLAPIPQSRHEHATRHAMDIYNSVIDQHDQQTLQRMLQTAGYEHNPYEQNLQL